MSAVLVRLNPVCDFCSTPEIVVAYLIEDFVLPEYMWGSTGGFAACEKCRDLIERKDRVGLEERAYWSFKFLHPVDEVPDEMVKTFIHRLHTEFWVRINTGVKATVQ